MRRAFSLVELLIVVTVIAILASVTMALAGYLRETSRRVVCGSNLRQWFAAITSHAVEHRGLVPMSPRNRFGGVTPHLMWTQHDQGLNAWAAPTMAEEWSMDVMSGYLEDGSGQETSTVAHMGGALHCPSARWNSSVYSSLAWGSALPNYFHGSYTYWVAISEPFPGIPGSYVPYTDDFSGRRLRAGTVLMEDSTGTFNGATLGINHTVYGATSYQPTRDLAGMNRLHGEGRVEWIPRSQLRPDRMAISATDDGAGMALRCIRNNAPDVLYY